MNSPLPFHEVTDRLKRIQGLRTDTRLAQALGLSPSAYNNRKKSGSLPYEAVCEYCLREGVSLDAVFGLDARVWKVADPQEMELLRAVRKLGEEDRWAILRHATALASTP